MANRGGPNVAAMAIEPFAPKSAPMAELSPTADVLRAPPANLEAEQALLGAILLNNRHLEAIAEFLRPDHFADPAHRTIFEACLLFHKKDRQADPVTLSAYLKADPALKEAGGGSYLSELAKSRIALIDALDYARFIHDLALRRDLIALGHDLMSDAFAEDIEKPATSQIETAEQKLYELGEKGEVNRGFRSFSKALTEAIEMAEVAHRRDGHLSGITTGLIDLDRKLGGLHKSDLVILAGRPGMGKTALATNVAYAAAYTYQQDPNGAGAPVAFFSLEMSADQLASRVLSTETEISSHKMRTGALSNDEFYRIAEAARTMEQLPLFIDDTPGLTVPAIRSRARRLKRQNGLGLIVIDYIQLISPPSGRRVENRVQELSEITRGLKILAKELDVPVLALSQLSRQVESRDDKRPLLADLRESGSIEQDADVVLFVYREHYYKEREHPVQKPSEADEKFHEREMKWREDCAALQNKAECIVAKQRHGPTGSVDLFFNGEFTQFGNWVASDYLPAG